MPQHRKIVVLSCALCLVALQGCASGHLSESAGRSVQRVALVGPQNPDRVALAAGNVYSAAALALAVGRGATAGELEGSLMVPLRMSRSRRHGRACGIRPSPPPACAPPSP